MRVTHTQTINASAERVVDVMMSADYLEALTQAIDVVSRVEELERAQEAGGELLRRVRYEAPTAGKIPSFLKKYQDKAPAFVHWEERGRWDSARRALSYEIVPEEVPAHWSKYYAVRGELKIVEEAADRARLESALEYEVKVFGLKRLIEGALKEEVEKILRTQAQVTARLSA